MVGWKERNDEERLRRAFEKQKVIAVWLTALISSDGGVRRGSWSPKITIVLIAGRLSWFESEGPSPREDACCTFAVRCAWSGGDLGVGDGLMRANWRSVGVNGMMMVRRASMGSMREDFDVHLASCRV